MLLECPFTEHKEVLCMIVVTKKQLEDTFEPWTLWFSPQFHLARITDSLRAPLTCEGKYGWDFDAWIFQTDTGYLRCLCHGHRELPGTRIPTDILERYKEKSEKLPEITPAIARQLCLDMMEEAAKRLYPDR